MDGPAHHALAQTLLFLAGLELALRGVATLLDGRPSTGAVWLGGAAVVTAARFVRSRAP